MEADHVSNNQNVSVQGSRVASREDPRNSALIHASFSSNSDRAALNIKRKGVGMSSAKAKVTRSNRVGCASDFKGLHPHLSRFSGDEDPWVHETSATPARVLWRWDNVMASSALKSALRSTACTQAVDLKTKLLLRSTGRRP
jgi:hypothetical protein